MRPNVTPAELELFLRSMAGKEAWEALRDAEIMRGYQPVPVGSVSWLSANDWNRRDCVSLNGNEVRLVAIGAKKPRNGSFYRLLAAIDQAGLTPCIVAPMGVMTSILERWGWERTEIGSTFADYEEQWRPPGRYGPHTGATWPAGPIVPPEAASPLGGAVSGQGDGNERTPPPDAPA